jgi:hypothetical protein
VRGLEFQPLRKHLAHDRRGRHRNGAAQRDAPFPRDVYPAFERETHHHGDRNGREHLQQAEPEHGAPHGAQLRERKLEADRKHQEHHTEFGEVLRAVRIGNDAERVRPHHDADREVAEHGWQVQIAEENDARH